ncbi:phosphotransferase family protein [Paenibacillus sp. L3-i20]|uniref:phosphotransferase family protein n=1 Tax=Paenibacillus sp. L3-i20 TaxID=2905833 RepID=UPI001EDED5EC|nr:phosphotransferase [Paenibacillus sp. L3-i20]GKU76470.1 hypothetical protein L3i20_v208670 [Paenibacillus sp. L3-i20]
MKENSGYIQAVLAAVEQYGFTNVTPNVLSDEGNLIVHLSPHPVVARVAIARSEADAVKACHIMKRELQVAMHLHTEGVPVLLPAELTDTVPLQAKGTWMTLWEYVPRTALQPLSPEEAYVMVHKLSTAMQSLPIALSPLSVWERVSESAEALRKQSDPRIHNLLKLFQSVDEEMRTGTRILLPCHGDAHARNLLASPRGPLWMDFEDVSLMPAYWDKASYVTNLALMSRFHEPTFRYMLQQAIEADQLDDFKFAVTARVLMSTLGNLDYALKGMGDLPFATRQLELAADFIRELTYIHHL